MADFKEERKTEILRQLASDFVKNEAGPSSLITVTRVLFNEKSGMAKVLFTVYPESKESGALEFLKRKRAELKQYVKKNSRIGRIPFFDFVPDKGEKTRQQIEKLSDKG